MCIKFFLVFVILSVGIVLAVPVQQTYQQQHHQQSYQQTKQYENEPVQILRYEYEPTDNGYKFEFETSDGQKRSEEAYTKKINDDVSVLAVYGSYSYTGDDGQLYSVEYIADENGFRPVGAHIPGNKAVTL